MPPLPRQLAAYKIAAVGHFLDSGLPFENQLVGIQSMLRFAARPALQLERVWIRAEDPSLRNHVFERRHSLAFYQRYRKENRR